MNLREEIESTVNRFTEDIDFSERNIWGDYKDTDSLDWDAIWDEVCQVALEAGYPDEDHIWQAIWVLIKEYRESRDYEIFVENLKYDQFVELHD